MKLYFGYYSLFLNATLPQGQHTEVLHMDEKGLQNNKNTPFTQGFASSTVMRDQAMASRGGRGSELVSSGCRGLTETRKQWILGRGWRATQTERSTYIHWGLQPGVPRSPWRWVAGKKGKTQVGIRLQFDVTRQVSTQTRMPQGSQTWVMEATTGRW